MNWDAIGAIGEILGAGGVIATLVYLAIQTRDNTHATNASSARAVSDKWVDVNMFVADRMHVLLGPDSDESRRSVTAHWRVILHQWQNIFVQYQKGLLDQQFFEAICREIPARVTNTPNLVMVWDIEKGFYRDDFRAFVDGLIGSDAADD